MNDISDIDRLLALGALADRRALIAETASALERILDTLPKDWRRRLRSAPPLPHPKSDAARLRFGQETEPYAQMAEEMADLKMTADLLEAWDRYSALSALNSQRVAAAKHVVIPELVAKWKQDIASNGVLAPDAAQAVTLFQARMAEHRWQPLLREIKVAGLERDGEALAALLGRIDDLMQDLQPRIQRVVKEEADNSFPLRPMVAMPGRPPALEPCMRLARLFGRAQVRCEALNNLAAHNALFAPHARNAAAIAQEVNAFDVLPRLKTLQAEGMLDSEDAAIVTGEYIEARGREPLGALRQGRRESIVATLALGSEERSSLAAYQAAIERQRAGGASGRTPAPSASR